MVRWCWVNFLLPISIRVGQGPTALVVGAGGGYLDIFSLVYHFSFLSPSLWETARYRLKYCLKGPLSQKQLTNQWSFENRVPLKPVLGDVADVAHFITGQEQTQTPSILISFL